MEPTQCIRIGYNSAMYKDMEPNQCIKIGYSSAIYKDMDSTQCVKIGGNVLRYGAESRKPSQCIKIGDPCIKIWSRLNVIR